MKTTSDVVRQFVTGPIPRGVDFESAVWAADTIVSMLNAAGLITTTSDTQDTPEPATAWPGVDELAALVEETITAHAGDDGAFVAEVSDAQLRAVAETLTARHEQATAALRAFVALPPHLARPRCR